MISTLLSPRLAPKFPRLWMHTLPLEHVWLTSDDTLRKTCSHSTMSYKFPIAINLEMEFYAQLYYLYICFALNLGFTHAVTTTVSLHVHSSWDVQKTSLLIIIHHFCLLYYYYQSSEMVSNPQKDELYIFYI